MKVEFKSRKLKSSIFKVNEKVKNNISAYKDYIVYGVTKGEGISLTGNVTSKDLSEYIVVDAKTFAFNPYRVNIGSIGLSDIEFKGLVSPAYVVFKTKKDLLSEFLFHYLKSDIGIKLINWYGNRGGVRNALRFDDLGEIDIPDLTVEQQEEALIKLETAQSGLDVLNEELDQQQTYLQHLRQTILQEAVQGKLTTQDPTDELATELLKRIKAEKEKLIKAGKLKKQKELPPITEDEIPFELPKGWAWCRLGEIINLRSGVTLGKTYKEELFEVPYLRVANVQRGYINVTHVKTIRVPKYEIEKYNLVDGDLCMIEGGDWDKVGRCGIWKNEISPCIHQNHIFRLRFYGSISNRWSEMFLNSPVARRYFESCSKQTTNLASINKTQLTNLIFPIPPLAEQQRIVAKVHQLQQQLTQLEAQAQQSRQYAQQLLQSVLKEAFEQKGKVYEMEEEAVLNMVAEE